jgi:four helix bundle protein
MRNPADLRVLGEARELAIETYLSTARFPGAERFGLTAQMRRAAVSIGSNIVEGCHRAGNRAFVVSFTTRLVPPLSFSFRSS